MFSSFVAGMCLSSSIQCLIDGNYRWAVANFVLFALNMLFIFI